MLDADIGLARKNNLNEKNDYIFLAGHKGLVGSSVYRALKAEGFKNIVTVDKKLDLRN